VSRTTGKRSIIIHCGPAGLGSKKKSHDPAK